MYHLATMFCGLPRGYRGYRRRRLFAPWLEEGQGFWPLSALMAAQEQGQQEQQHAGSSTGAGQVAASL